MILIVFQVSTAFGATTAQFIKPHRGGGNARYKYFEQFKQGEYSLIDAIISNWALMYVYS